MKKFLTFSFVITAMLSLTSCFLFQTHESCPAYGEINKKAEKTDPTNNSPENFKITLEDKA